MSGRPSLAGAFAPATPSRGAALQGLLAPKRGRGTQAPEPKAPEESVEVPAREPIQAPPAAPEPVKETTPTEAAPAKAETAEAPVPDPVPAPVKAPKTATRQQPSAKKPAPTVKASETVPGALRNVGVYLPPALLAEVKDAVYQERTTYADLLIDAFEAVDDEQIAGEFTPEMTQTSSGMPRRAPRKRGEAGIQIQLRLDGLQVAWLDEKVTEFDAPSRSALVSAVFKLHMQAGRTAGE
jgi:outer membrane biosynthesis protein TonB